MSPFLQNSWSGTAEVVVRRIAGAVNRYAEEKTDWLHGETDAMQQGAVELARTDRHAESSMVNATGLVELYHRSALDLGVADGPAYAEVGVAAQASRAVGEFNWFGMSTRERVNHDIDIGLDRLNPGWNSGDPQWRGNCASVVTAFELRQRGYSVEAGPLAEQLLKHNGVYALHHEFVWGRQIVEHDKEGLPFIFREPGSRGIVFVRWPDATMHTFNVVHVPGEGLRYVDGQSDPPVRDASRYLVNGTVVASLRVDDLEPLPSAVVDFGVRFLDPNQSLPGGNER
ncbi:hypothetical protein [Nocardia brasiliensis]|uniref:hypothetical protein n=1 Tax=Nocardia brasiliensis TaxID=37326 RepID=UPI0024589022|nr:hypothetical protein [Nocardia brasiliensis]